MSEELNKKTEQYQYMPGENEKLITDKPSEPLTVVSKPKMQKNIPKPEIPTIVEKILPRPAQKPIIKSNKELYISYIKELKNFSLSINDEIIYDSSIDKSKESPVKFENDYFILYGRKYSYNGLKIQKIN